MAEVITEYRNENTKDIDILSTVDMVRKMNEEDRLVALAVEDETEIVALLIGEEEDDESFFIPVYTSEEEANKAIEFFQGQEGSGEFELDNGKGSEIIAAYTEDDDFLGLAINAPENGFVVFAETVHDCCDE